MEGQGDNIQEQVVGQPDPVAEEPQQSEVVEEPIQETPQVNPDIEKLQQQLDDERRKAEFYQQMAMMSQYQQPAPKQEKEEYLDPNYVPTGTEIQEIVQREIQKNVGPLKSNQKEQLIMLQEELMRRNPDTSDYDDVIKTYSTDLFKKNPGLYDSIYAMPNAAQLAYNLGKSHPDYQKKITAKTSQDVANQINKNLRKPASVVSVGGKSSSNGAPDYATMSKEDLEKEIRKVKGL